MIVGESNNCSWILYYDMPCVQWIFSITCYILPSKISNFCVNLEQSEPNGEKGSKLQAKKYFEFLMLEHRFIWHCPDLHFNFYIFSELWNFPAPFSFLVDLISIFFVFIIAERALKELNFTNLNGKPIRISYSNRDSSSRRNSAANIFVKVLFP